MTERGGVGVKPRADVSEELPLAGFTVAVTADRRSDELSTLLEGCGARVVPAPALRIVPVADDTELKAATATCVDNPMYGALSAHFQGGWLVPRPCSERSRWRRLRRFPHPLEEPAFGTPSHGRRLRGASD